MIIRPEKPADRDAIRTINLDAFDSDTEANLVDALRDSGTEFISLVAESKDTLVGHILFSPVTCTGDAKIMGLAPMAVRKAWQRQGVGTQLVEAGLQACRQAGAVAVIVLGHPQYYPRFGFEPAANHGIESEYEVAAEVFMVKALQPGALDAINGLLRYHPAFPAL
jgi:putative acetyltransferase